MNLRLVSDLTDTDRKLLHRAIDGFLPECIFDAHAHLFHTRHFALGSRPQFLEENRGYGMQAFQAAMALWMPGRRVEGLFFGYPSAGNDRRGENAWVQAQVDASTNSRALVLASPKDDPLEVRRLMSTGVFVGIKPYRVYADVADTREAEIEDFAPEWMWEVCNDHQGILVLHIMKAEGITDQRNVESIRRLCRRYPRCRLILAHVARSFNYRHAREGLHLLIDLDNVAVDTSAVTQTGAFRAALDVLGPRRVLWGSDYMVSELRGSCVTQGDGFTWIHPELGAATLTIFGQYTTIGIESLLCLREACEDTGMTAEDLQDIFRNNALRLLAPNLRKGVLPPEASGPELSERARESISCGTGLQSKRPQSFDPASWPAYFSRCKGVHLWDTNGRRYLDFTGGVGAILLGHADDAVNAAVKRRINLGSYCTLASPDEITLAENLLGLHPWAGKVRFARGGGEALGLAVRIARCATGKSGIAFCGYHGWSDWYLAANLGSSHELDGHLMPGLEPIGVPRELTGTAQPFKYNDLEAFERALSKLGSNLAAVVMEPMRTEMPANDFLKKVASRCRQLNAVFVVDEVTAGWRFGFPGGCARLGVEPDIAVYAKAMSNGFPCAAVVGRESVMDAANGSFISSSYWTDGVGSAAALACIAKMTENQVQQSVWSLGEFVQQGLREMAAQHAGLNLRIASMPCAPSIAFQLGNRSAAAKTLMIRKMLSRGITFSGQLYLMWPHTKNDVETMLSALDETLDEIGRSSDSGRLESDAGLNQSSAGFARLA